MLAGCRGRRHYLHHDYAKEKKKLHRLLGEKLTEIVIGQDGLEACDTIDVCVSAYAIFLFQSAKSVRSVVAHPE